VNVALKVAKSARKAKGDGHLRRAEILDAAARIFAADGYEGATIRRIADEVGVSSTALYMHFRDKDEILHEICQDAIRMMVEEISAIADEPADPVERVRRILVANVRGWLAQPHVFRLIYYSDRSGSEETEAAKAGHRARFYDRYLNVVREVATSGRLRVGDTESAAQGMWAACHGLISMLIVRPSFGWAPADTLTNVMIDGLLYGTVTV